MVGYSRAMKVLARLTKKMAELVLVTLYFAASFVLVGVVKMLFLAEYGIDGFDLIKSLVGALVIAKVVIVLDKTSWGDRFRRHALLVDVVYKAAVYSIVVIVVFAIEKVVHQIPDTGTVRGAVDAALAGANGSRFGAMALCIYLIFFGYAVVTTIAQHFGRGELLRFIVDRHARAAGTKGEPLPDDNSPEP